MQRKKSSRVTIDDVAKLAGVSKSTVSRYINGLNMHNHTRARVREAIEELEFTENYFAKQVKSRSQKSICLIVSSFLNNFEMNFAYSLSIIADRNNTEFMLINTELSAESLRKKMQYAFSRMADGIIVFPSLMTKERTDVIREFYSKIPVVVMDTFHKDLKCTYILSDDANSSRRAVQYLVDNGHKRIAFLVGGLNHLFVSDERYRGYVEGMQNNGIVIRPEYVVNCMDFDKESYNRNITNLLNLPEPPTSIFAYNYNLTVGVYNTTKEMNLKIPEDISLIGYDYYGLTENIAPHFTCLDQSEDMLAQAAFDKILTMINGGWSRTENDIQKVKTRLVINSSVKKISN